MASDPYVKSGGVIPRRTGGITRNISGLANAIRRVQAGSTSGLNTPSQGNNGNGAAAVAPSALDSLPKTPEIQALIDKGILRADMAPEQILAIVGLSSAVAGVPIDIAALKAQLAQDYASTTGNILGMGADWMQQMFGMNMPGSQPGLNYQNGQWLDANGVVQGTATTEDSGFTPSGPGWDFAHGQWNNPQGQPVGTTEGGAEDAGLNAFPYISTGATNSQAYANDPLFSNYANSLAQQQATAGLNQATDQAWFDKQQQAMTDYYNGLMQSIAMGTGDTSGGGGGGGGGGGRRHGYGGGGGGSGGGDGDWGFTDPATTSTQTEQIVAKSSDRESQMWPEYKNEVYDAAVAQFGVDDPRTQYVLDTLDTTTGPDPALEQVANDMTAAQTTIANRNALDENNKTWTQAAPANFEGLRNEYERLTGNTLGDTTPEDAFQWQAPGANTDIDLAQIAPGSVGAKIMELMSQAYDPSNPNAMPVNPVTGAPQVGSNEGMDQAAAWLNQVLNVGADRRDAKTSSAVDQLIQAAQNRMNPQASGSLGGKSSIGPQAGVAGVAGGGMSTTQANPYTPAVPGAYSPLSSANAGSISGGPGTSQLTPETVMNGTYIPALNQTDQAANVSPYDSSLGDPLRRYYEQMAQQGTTPPAVVPGTTTSPGAYLAGMKPHPGQNAIPFDQLIHPPTIQSDPALVDPAYSSAQGGPIAELMAELGQTGGIPAGAGIDQLPPEIMQAAAQGSNGPPGITEINHALLQAGLPLLDSTGHLTDAIPGYGPSGNTRPMLGQGALLGMSSNKTDPRIQQAAYSKLAGTSSSAGPGQDSSQLSALTRAMQFLQDVHDSSSEGPISGNTVYDQIIGNVAVTPQTTDQFGRQVPSKLRPDLLASMQNLSGFQKMEASRGVDPSLFHPNPGEYYEVPSPELSGEALSDAQMVNILAPGLRDMIRAHSTLWDMNPYSRHVDNTGTSTQQLQTKQKSYDPDVANAVAAGNLNDFAAVPDLITQPYDQTGQPIFTDEDYQGAPPGDLLDVNLGGGGGLPNGLKSMAIRRISQPTPKAPLTSGKSHIKPGSSGKKTYSKGGGAKKSYVTTGKTLPYKPKQKYFKK